MSAGKPGTVYEVYRPLPGGRRRTYATCASHDSAKDMAISLSRSSGDGTAFHVTGWSTAAHEFDFCVGGGWYETFRVDPDTGAVETTSVS